MQWWCCFGLAMLHCSQSSVAAVDGTDIARESRVAVALATPRLKAAFRVKLSQWRRAGQLPKRRDYVAALLARISDTNPVLTDLDAFVMKGNWTVGPLLSLDGRARSELLESSVPEAGGRLSGKPGEICLPGCHDIGFEPHTFDYDRESKAAGIFGLTESQRGWTALIDGKAAWTLYRDGPQLVILVTTCERRWSECGPAAILLTPQGNAKFEALK